METKHGGGHRTRQSEMSVFTKTKELISLTFNITENWPKKYRFDLTERMRNTALDIFERITEANEIFIAKPALDQKARKKMFSTYNFQKE